MSTPAGGDQLRTVQLRGVPVALSHRARERHLTLTRELALVDAADQPDHVARRLLQLSGELNDRYDRFAAAPRALVEDARRRDVSTVDLTYDVPAEVADAAERLDALLDEVDRYCASGELVTMATPPDELAYRRWALQQFVAQIREGAAPTPWRGDGASTSGHSVGATPRPPATGTVVRVDDDLDLEGAAVLRTSIAEHLERGTTELTVDLAGCEFVDSVGISLLLTTWERLRDLGGTLRVVNLRPTVERTFHHGGVLDLLVGT
jgi:anti-anti-sigma factor